jgi:hypothetical protein
MIEWEDELHTLQALVSKGLFVDNLRELQRVSTRLITPSQYPTVFFTLETIFHDVEMAWDERPVTVEHYEEIRDNLTKPIQNLLSALEVGSDRDVIANRLETLIRTFVEVRPVL